MIIRPYNEDDAVAVGELIALTYRTFNLGFVPDAEQGLFMGPFQHAGSNDKAHQDAIAGVIRSEMVFVAETDGTIVGVLRGRADRLASLFVSGRWHRQGIGSRLVKRFETECLRKGSTVLRVAATLHAVPFYLAMGYRKSTGVRSGWSFEGHGLPVQPMKKVLRQAP